MRKKRDLTDLLERMSGVVWPALRIEYTADCCIAAAAILMRVLKLYGYPSRAVPVTAYIFNPAMVRYLNTLPPGAPLTGSDVEKLFPINGAWSVGIVPASAHRAPVRGGRFGGHILVNVGPYLVDASLKQAERPQRNILIPDLIVTRPDVNFWQGGPMDVDIHGCLLRYSRHDDYSFKSAPDWVRTGTPVPETVHRIIEGIEADRSGPASQASETG